MQNPRNEVDAFGNFISVMLLLLLALMIGGCVWAGIISHHNDVENDKALAARTPAQVQRDYDWEHGKPFFLHEVDGVRVYVFLDQGNGRRVYFTSTGSMQYTYRQGKKDITVHYPGDPDVTVQRDSTQNH